MIETAAALVLAHVLADFVFQTDAMVRSKALPGVLLVHVAIVAAASWAALGLAPAAGPILLVGISHLVIDWLKQRHGSQTFGPFALDQAAHLAMIALAAALWPASYTAGLWGLPWPSGLDAAKAHAPQAMVLVAGLVAAVWAGGHAVRAMMAGLPIPADPTEDDRLPQGGRLIGRLERLLILMLVLADYTAGIGFLIAAKSVLRFSELARDRDRRVSEYVIIGTLASFAWGLAVSFATAAALRALAP